MPPAPGSPFDGIDRLVVDGTNMLYRMGSRTAAPPAAIVGRLRAAIPPTISIDLLFDGIGHGVKGRVAQHMYVRYSGRHTADEAILGLTAAVGEAAGGSPEAYERMLVVTNDRDLRERLEARGVRTRPDPVAPQPAGHAAAGLAGAGEPQADDRVRAHDGDAQPVRARRVGPAGLEAGPGGHHEDGYRPQGRTPQAPPEARRLRGTPAASASTRLGGSQCVVFTISAAAGDVQPTAGSPASMRP